MAAYYVSSVDGSDADNGSTWALAKATIAGALAVATADGDIIYVDSAHAEAGAPITWNIATAGISVAIISVNRAGSTTTGHSGWLAGATATINANANAFTIAGTGAQHMFLSGISAIQNNGSGNNQLLICQTVAIASFTAHSCTFTNPNTNTNPGMQVGGGPGGGVPGAKIKLINCTFNLQNSNTVTYGIGLRYADIFMAGLTVGYAGANKPVTLFSSSALRAEIVDSDLSGYEKSGGFYFTVAQSAGFGGAVIMRNCKLSATPGMTTGTWLSDTQSITLINVDSGDTHNVFEHRTALGTLLESTSIYSDTGGQFDGAGISWQVVTTALCSESRPFVLPWQMKWVPSTSSITAGIRVVHDSATALHDRNLWQEIEYLSDASFPKGTLVSGRNAQPFDGSTANWASDSDTWTGTGGFSNQNKQKLESTFTPAEKSVIRGRLSVGIASKTLYVDPRLRVA